MRKARPFLTGLENLEGETVGMLGRRSSAAASSTRRREGGGSWSSFKLSCFNCSKLATFTICISRATDFSLLKYFLQRHKNLLHAAFRLAAKSDCFLIVCIKLQSVFAISCRLIKVTSFKKDFSERNMTID